MHSGVCVRSGAVVASSGWVIYGGVLSVVATPAAEVVNTLTAVNILSWVGG